MIKFKLHNNWTDDFIKIKSSLRVVQMVGATRSKLRFYHNIRVSMYVSIIGSSLGMTEKQLRYLGLAGFMHDIGFVAINDCILDKPAGLLPGEYQLIKSHPQIGMQILDLMRLPDDVIKAVTQHHECYNGEGYPLGLKGERISLYGRILFLAETFDAMTNDMPYRDACTIDAAMSFIKNMSGKRFDPVLVDIVLNSEEISAFYYGKDRISSDSLFILSNLSR